MTLSIQDCLHKYHNITTLPLCWVSRCVCCYADCRYAQCHYAECHYAECHYAECRGHISLLPSIGPYYNHAKSGVPLLFCQNVCEQEIFNLIQKNFLLNIFERVGQSLKLAAFCLKIDDKNESGSTQSTSHSPLWLQVNSSKNNFADRRLVDIYMAPNVWSTVD
jgi:hypothetical protein